LNQENPSSPPKPANGQTTEEPRRPNPNEKQMDLTVLSKLTIAELQKIGRDLKLETPVGLRKQELIAKILEGQAKESGMIYDEGVLEILPDGFGFLRSPNYNY